MASHFGPQRPPYVEFETRVEEDREQSLAVGGYVGKDVDYAIVRAIGAKDAVEWAVDVWFAKIEKDMDWSRDWVKFFKEQYKEWKAGNEAPVNGTHLKNWAGLSPAECKTLVAAGIRTVEDVAGANEEALQRIGMGARGIKQRAQAWLDTRNPDSEELALLREKTTNQELTIATLQTQLDKLATRIEKLTGTEDEEEDAAPKPARRRA
jgi:hypothetical protein